MFPVFTVTKLTVVPRHLLDMVTRALQLPILHSMEHIVKEHHPAHLAPFSEAMQSLAASGHEMEMDISQCLSWCSTFLYLLLNPPYLSSEKQHFILGAPQIDLRHHCTREIRWWGTHQSRPPDCCGIFLSGKLYLTRSSSYVSSCFLT